MPLSRRKLNHSDVLIIGTGLSGLAYAIKMAEARKDLTITIVSKTTLQENNTYYAQGGIAATLEKDNTSVAKHIEDTLKAGEGSCNVDIVTKVITDAPQMIKDLMRWGVKFDQTTSGKFLLGLEGGHSQNRILHCKDFTGKSIIKALIYQTQKHDNIQILTHQTLVELIVQQKKCAGAILYDQQLKTCYVIYASRTILATGGCGQIYQYTTNPTIATGDGIALAHKAGALIKNMEFIQFHPTAFYEPEKSRLFLLSEAMRGEGAYIINEKKENFLKHYNKNQALATRDIVARGIEQTLQTQNQKHVWLDCRHISPIFLQKRFPKIVQYLQKKHVDPSKSLIPIIPAAHYQCGGVVVDAHARTNLQHLYCLGEVAYTGLHGANRLASNSLLEAITFAHYCFKKTSEEYFDKKHITNVILPKVISSDHSKLYTLIVKEIKQIMQKKVGIIRSNQNLTAAKKSIQKIQEKITTTQSEKKIFQLQINHIQQLCFVANIIIKQAIERKKNCGGHYNIDH